MNLCKLGAALLAVTSIGSRRDGTVTIRGVHYVFSNAEPIEFDLPKGTAEKHIKVQGDPAQVLSPERGLTVRGKILEVNWAELGPKVTEVRKGRVEGDASIVIDGELAQRTLEENSKIANKPAPPKPPETKVMEAHSEVFTYEGSVDKGTLNFSNPWTFSQSSRGFQKAQAKGKHDINFDQTVDATGSSGQMNLVKGKDDSLDQLSTGHLAGPVHLKIVRHETEADSAKTTTTTYILVADAVDIDMLTKPGTITAQGHVTLDSDDGTTAVNFKWDQSVFAVDENFQILGFKAHGTPGVTTAKTKEGTN